MEKQLDKLMGLKTYAMIRNEEIKKLLNLLLSQDEDKQIRFGDVTVVLEDIMYRTKKLGKILQKIDGTLIQISSGNKVV